MSQQSITLKLDPELISKIDQHRGELTREDFVRLCVANMFANGGKYSAHSSEAGLAKPPSGADYVTKEDFEQFKSEIEKYHFELASLLTRFCQEHAGELDAATGPHFYEQFIKLLQS